MSLQSIQLKVEGQQVKVLSLPQLVSGSTGVYAAEFTFDKLWDGYAKTAVFSIGQVARECLMTDSTCIVPAEILRGNQKLKIGVYGVLGAVFLPTVWSEEIHIAQGAGPAQEAATPSPSLISQLMTVIGDLSSLETEDKASLVAAINEICQTGGGSTGVSVTDAVIDASYHLILTLSNDETIDAGYCGGENGVTPHIGANGNWYLGDTDTGMPSRGIAGINGRDGTDGADGKDGIDGKDGAKGADGVSPTFTVTPITGGHKITITDVNGVNTIDLYHGVDGAQGIQGPAGETGTSGTDGQSAYAAAQAGGYAGSEAEFYVDLAAMENLASWFAAL